MYIIIGYLASTKNYNYLLIICVSGEADWLGGYSMAKTFEEDPNREHKHHCWHEVS